VKHELRVRIGSDDRERNVKRSAARSKLKRPRTGIQEPSTKTDGREPEGARCFSPARRPRLLGTNDMQESRARKLWNRIRYTAPVTTELPVSPTATLIDPLINMTRLVAASTRELDSNDRGGAENFLIQAVELAQMPDAKARTTYVRHFYELGELWSSLTPSDTDLVRKYGALGTGQAREDLSLWFKVNYDWDIAARKCQWPRPETARFHGAPDPARRQYLAVIAVASETVQGIRFLDDVVTQAFSATTRIDADYQLATITQQLLTAADTREKIGPRPLGTSAEIIHAQQIWHRQNRELEDRVWTPALERVAALTVYRDKLHAVRTQTFAIERMRNTAGTGYIGGNLTAATVRDDLGSVGTISGPVELVHAEAAGRKALSELHGDYLTILRP
jgi:hypothetical protein